MARVRLETFEPGGEAATLLAPAEIEELRLAAFERGYAAGWDDAVAAQEDGAARLRADLARNLQTLSFTYHEARAHVLAALEPLLLGMASTVLPAIAREALGPVVLETLLPLARDRAAVPVEVTLSPAARSAVEPLLSAAAGLPFTFIEDAALGEGQACLRLGGVEAKVDLEAATAAVAAAVEAFFHAGAKETSHD